MRCLEALQKGDSVSLEKLEARIFERLMSAFKEVYIIDLEAELVMAYMKEGQAAAALGVEWHAKPFTEAITEYVRRLVVKEEQSYVLSQMTLDNLRLHFAEHASLAYECHKLLPEGRVHSYAKLIKLSDHEIILSLNDIRDDCEENVFTQGRKLLVVEDVDMNREILVSIFEDDYQVLEASNGQEALALLEANHEEIEVIITDLDMPICDGQEFIRRVRLNHDYAAIPIIVTTASVAKETELACLKLGASDFATKPYEPEILKNRVKNFETLRNSTAMLNTLVKDPPTGLYTKAYFDLKAHEIVDANPGKEYWLFCCRIYYLRRLREKYGPLTADDILEYVAHAIQRYCPGLVLGGRATEDVFCFLQEKIDDYDKEDIIHKISKISKEAPTGNVLVKFGRAEVDRSLPIDTICTYARMALKSIKDAYDEYLAEFDSSMYDRQKLEGNIIDSMEQALAEKQFLVYYQPKHNLRKDCTGGAEALVRWVHPEFGFMNPGAFIPLFEKNGFIRKLDNYVWERVCQDLARWKQQGVPVVPVSVNISRRDFEDDNLAETIIQRVADYGLEPKDLHLEITESAYSDNPEKIAKAMSILHDHGFVIELDDFGAGYSSLTFLNNSNLDVMKIDMSIIRKDVPGSERNVLELCLNTAKLLGMKTVAEGVETKEQVERLRALGCDYIQGYYYSAPRPLKQFEEYLALTKEEGNG